MPHVSTLTSNMMMSFGDVAKNEFVDPQMTEQDAKDSGR